MSYNANSIKVKSFVQACQDSVGMYLGVDGKDGIFNGWMEILNNSCDELIMGRGNTIIVSLNGDEISVEDFGAGIPRGANENCEEVLVELFTKAHSSGKFDSANYKKVRGLHGKL